MEPFLSRLKSQMVGRSEGQKVRGFGSRNDGRNDEGVGGSVDRGIWRSSSVTTHLTSPIEDHLCELLGSRGNFGRMEDVGACQIPSMVID